MRKIFNTFAYAAIAALALSSCAKEKLQPADELTGKLVTVHFGTENTDPSTKATLTPNDGETAFQAAWENGDQILISYSYNYENPSTTTGSWKDKSFEAKLPAGNGVWMYDAAYPVPAENNSVDFGSNRTQNGNAYNSKYDIMIGSAVAEGADEGKDAQGNDIIFKMDRQTAIAYFHFTSKVDEAITSATLTVGGDGAAIASSSAHISNFVWDASEDLTSITITFPEKAPNAQDFQLWFNVLETIYSSMSLTVETATKTFTISKSTDGVYEAGKLYKVKKDGISWTDKGGSVTPSEVTDVITADKLAATSTSYTDFSNVKISSNAVYAGNNAKTTTGAIQLRSSNSNSGIVSTTSGGKATKVSVVWASDTADGRTIDIYGNNSPYTNAKELYSTGINTNQGTKIGSIVCGTSTELVIDGNYPYVGIRSNSGALYLESVSITWESGSSEPTPDTYSVSCATVTGGTLSATPASAEAGTEISLTATPDAEYTFNNDWTVTNAETSETISVTDGKFTMPDANVNVSASFTQKTYTITANAAENGTYTVKVGDTEVTSAAKGEKVVLDATPDEGYLCDGWTVVDAEGNNVSVSNNAFYMPASDVTISTSFSLKPADITYDHAGTIEDPYSVADVLKYISTLGTDPSTVDVYVKGVIASITEVSTSFGNATYKIKDEGVENELLVYRGYYLEGAKFTSEDQIRVGDEVVVAGKVKNYNDTPEFDKGNKLVSIVKAPYLQVSASKTSVEAAGETITITVDTNIDGWKATSDNADFVVGTPSGNTVDVVVSKNTDASERTATITVSAGTLSETITLTQKAAGAAADVKETIDFESASTAYTFWTFTNMTSKQTGAITANGGTYYGTTGGKATASITSTNIIAKPKSITFYVSKESNNTTSSSWKIQVSSDKSTWTDVKTQSATSMSKGSWVEVTQDLSSYSKVYVRVFYTGSTAVRNIDNLSLTYSN